MDEIRIGLDFGTHQTKICVCRIPDEGHGQPEYEFFKFTDQNGNKQYYIPSVVQINKDDTLSYGYVDSNKEKDSLQKPEKEVIEDTSLVQLESKTKALFDKYSNETTSPEDISILRTLLEYMYGKNGKMHSELIDETNKRYAEKMRDYNNSKNTFRYFKQATFSEYPWERKIDSTTLCIWYIAYILFLLEEIYEDAFFINLGVPADDRTFRQKQELGVRVLKSAFYLVENVYNRRIDDFLQEKYTSLLEKTKFFPYTDEIKEDYNIMVFPEAYASLIGMTSKGKLSEGMSINVDIGGGTTDISFFTIQNRIPYIYRYFSIPYGLNYIAEQSGFDYADGYFSINAKPRIIMDYNNKKKEIVQQIESDLLSQLRSVSKISKKNLFDALKNRILIYNGGGSTYHFLDVAMSHFSDIKVYTIKYWDEENIKEKSQVRRYVNILATAYGLSLAYDDQDVVLCDFGTLFTGFSSEDKTKEIHEIDKDVC